VLEARETFAELRSDWAGGTSFDFAQDTLCPYVGLVVHDVPIFSCKD
jgi:hypothetical protein